MITESFPALITHHSALITSPMNMHELTRVYVQPNNSKIVLLVADGLGGLPLEPGGKTELETARTPNLDALARRASRAEHSGPAGHHAGQRAGAPGPVRLRSSAVSHRPRHSGSDRHRLRARAARRGRPRQLLHARRRRARSPTAGPADRRDESAAWPCACGRSRFRASKFSSSRSRSIASSSSSAATAWAATSRHRSAVPASRRWQPKAAKPGSEKTAEVAAEFITQASKLLAGEKKANGLTLRGFSA